MKDKTRYHSKLSKEQVNEIKAHLLDERGIKQDWIARKFGVNQSTIAHYNRQLKNKNNGIKN